MKTRISFDSAMFNKPGLIIKREKTQENETLVHDRFQV